MSRLTRARRSGAPWLVVPVLAPLAIWFESARAGRVLAPGDGLTYYLPVHVLAARTWRRGVLPGWDPWSFAGSPLLATSQVGALYPPNLVHLLLPPAAAHDLLLMTAFAVAGLGAALLALHLTGDAVAGAAGGAAFGLSGFLFGHLNHLSLVATAGWLPWTLLALERLLDRRDRRSLALAALPVGAACLAGHPQLLLVVVAVTALWGAGVAVVERSPRPLLLAAGQLAAGLLLGAVQLLPVAAHLGVSDRTSLAFREAMSFSFSPSSGILVLFPHLFGSRGGSGPFTAPYLGEWSQTELSGYVGAAALVLAAAGATAAHRRGRLLPVTAVAGVACLVALGDSTPFGRVVHALPLIGQLRSWGRATVALDLAVAVLAAFGVASVRARAPGVRRTTVVAAAAVVVLAAGAWWLPDRAPAPHAGWALGLPAVAAVAAAAAARLPRRMGGAVLVALVTLDMFVSFGWWHRWRSESPTAEVVAAAVDPRVPPRWGPVADAPGGIDRVAFAFEEPLRAVPDVPRATGAKQIRTVGGYDPLAPGDHLDAVGMDYRGVVREPRWLLQQDSHVADLLRVTWVVDEELRGHPRRARIPEAFLVGEARGAARVEAVAAARGALGLAPTDTVLVEGCEPCLTADVPGPAGTAGPVRWGPSSARLEVRAARHALLVVSQAWAPGWTARVDGEVAPVVRVDGLVQGVPVGPGHHSVELRHEPPGLRVGAATSGATVLALAALAVSARSRTTSARPGRRATSRRPPTPGTRT